MKPWLRAIALRRNWNIRAAPEVRCLEEPRTQSRGQSAKIGCAVTRFPMRQRSGSHRMFSCLLPLALAGSSLLIRPAEAQNQITSPEKSFGRLGADRKMARRDKIVGITTQALRRGPLFAVACSAVLAAAFSEKVLGELLISAIVIARIAIFAY